VLVNLKLIYQIKVTQGITGLIDSKAHIHKMHWHLDVGLSVTNICNRFISMSAHHIISYVSWVQNDVNQFGLYL